MSYLRVIPRDLFNEAKLLKCIGRLCLLIHDNTVPCKMEFVHNGEVFDIVQTQDGDLMIDNVTIKVKGKVFNFKCHLNSKSNYTLYLYCDIEGIVDVFDEAGNFEKEFLDFCKTI
jgi:hypothetical protein